MQAFSIAPVSRYLNSPLRTLYDACRAMGRDKDGRACATCPVRDLCVAKLSRAGAPAIAPQSMT